jgi:hypothetical protein
MELYLRQQFDLILAEATGNFVERVVHRCGGEEAALERLRSDPNGEGVWIDEFVNNFFEEHLLTGVAGAAFVLQALEKRTVPADDGGTVGDVINRLARLAFADVLAQQSAQLIQRSMVYN